MRSPLSACRCAQRGARDALARLGSAQLPPCAAQIGGPRTAPSKTGTSFLPAATVERAAKEGNPIEKAKLAKDGTSAFTDVYEYAAAIRAGTLDWEQVEKEDMNTRLKWVGLLHRAKRTPGRFMMRLRTPNGIVNADLMRFYADTVEKYGDIGCVDITTRQNIQLRSPPLADAAEIIEGLHARNQTSFQSALDNVRNMVGSPLAGIDDQEMVDTRPITNALNDLISLDPETGERGNPKWGNLPRKFNIAVSGSRDDFAHTNINDIGLVPTVHAKTGEVGFNVEVGGYMSIKRVAAAIPLDLWIPAEVDAALDLSTAILMIFRDEGARANRQEHERASEHEHRLMRQEVMLREANAQRAGATAAASFLAAVLTEIYLCDVGSCRYSLGRNGRGQEAVGVQVLPAYTTGKTASELRAAIRTIEQESRLEGR